jgi:large subunit ribosomal protein L1
MRMGCDPRKSDQMIRGTVSLPHGTGKDVRVVVFAGGAAAEAAKAAGAIEAGTDELLEKIKGGWMDFDVAIATPEAMTAVRKLARVLGPRGLMPNPKTGTVTEKVGDAVREAKAGRAEFRADRGACVQVPIGKLSFEADAIVENAVAVIKALIKAKPSSAKGVYIQSITLSATMTPGVKVDIREASVKETA